MRAFTVLLFLVSGCTTSNYNAALRFTGYIDTDLAFSQFVGGDHTVAFRFMPQYTMIAEAPVLSINGTGSYAIGLGAYRAGGASAVKLMVRVGSAIGYYSLGNPSTDGAKIPLEAEWHTLAVSKKGLTFTLYLDGKHVAQDGGGDLTASAADVSALSGTLRFGREASGEAQFYGLIDDVMVLGRALDKSQVATLFASAQVSVSSAQSLGLLRGWSFDTALPSGGALPAELSHPITIQNPAYVVLGSSTRDSATDALFLPAPYQQERLRLPFAPGVSWTVRQGNEGLASHNDFAAFSLDLVRGDPPPAAALPGSTTCGTQIFVAGTGEITDGCDLGDPPVTGGIPDLTQGCAGSASQFASDGPLIDGYDVVHIADPGGEHQTYQHVQKGSLREAFPSQATFFHSPVVTGPTGTIPVTAGQWLGRAGTRGVNDCHLHFAVADSKVTYPAAFFDFEYFDTEAKAWRTTTRDIPKFGQWIRLAPLTTPLPPQPDRAAICTVAQKRQNDARAERQRAWQELRGGKLSGEARQSQAKKARALTQELDELQTTCRQ